MKDYKSKNSATTMLLGFSSTIVTEPGFKAAAVDDVSRQRLFGNLRRTIEAMNFDGFGKFSDDHN